MYKINGLPKNAFIKIKLGLSLRIKDQKIVGSDDGIMDWLIYQIKHESWHQALPQLISQGFKFDAVRERCIEELKDPRRLGMVFWLITDNPNYSKKDRKAIVQYITEKLNSYKNWKQFYYAFIRLYKFNSDMMREIKKQWGHTLYQTGKGGNENRKQSLQGDIQKK